MTQMKFFNTIICKDTNEIANSYEEYLKTKHWRKIRLKVAKKKKYTCENCGKKIEVGFHIHHKTYSNIGNEKIKDLMFLCEDCHSEVHTFIRLKKENMKKPKSDRKNCSTCYYSQLMELKGKQPKTVLWCNKKCFQCRDNLCTYYKKGQLKEIPKKTKRRIDKRKNK